MTRKMVMGLVCGLLTVGMQGQSGFGGNSMTVDNFKVVEYTPEGELDWALFGEKAVVLGDRVTLEVVQANLRQGDRTTIVRSPACRFDRGARIVRSHSGVAVHGKGMVITGDGFDLDLEKHQLLVRRNVRIQLSRTESPEFGNRGLKE